MVRNTDTATVTLRFTRPDGSSGLGSNPSYTVAALASNSASTGYGAPDANGSGLQLYFPQV